ncbi:MAG: hypothetical protein IT267_01060 [Saprospiraceae bacterium]|nr:hypothetical protein [Saprospiraceae bacterium]
MHSKFLITLYFLFYTYNTIIYSQAFSYSMVYTKGQSEFQIFNNLYTERKTLSKDYLYTYYNTLFFTYIFGLNSNFNVGLRPRIRRVVRKTLPSLSEIISFNSLYNSSIDYTRSAFTGIELIVRHPIHLGNTQFTIQHQIGIPIGPDNQGSDKKAFIDWTGTILHTQLFYSYYLNNLQIFIESGIRLENVTKGTLTGGSLYFTYLGFPITFLPGFAINSKNHIYLQFQLTPRWALQNQSRDYYDPYGQFGLGYKFFFQKKYEIELLFSRFYSTADLNYAYTINIGFRKLWRKNIY